MAREATEAQTLRHQIDALKALIRRDWHDLTAKELTKDEDLRIRKSADELSVELAAFIQRLDKLAN